MKLERRGEAEKAPSSSSNLHLLTRLNAKKKKEREEREGQIRVKTEKREEKATCIVSRYNFNRKLWEKVSNGEKRRKRNMQMRGE